MSKKGKLIFGIITIVWAFISCGVGLWALSSMENHNLIMTFCLMSNPGVTTLAIINLLRDKK